MTLPEVLLWNRLRPKVNNRCIIRRQVAVLGDYVVDLYCAKMKIAFEIDSRAAHEDREVQDTLRQQAIETIGIRFVRISAARVLKHPDEVANTIIMICTGELNLEDLE